MDKKIPHLSHAAVGLFPDDATLQLAENGTSRTAGASHPQEAFQSTATTVTLEAILLLQQEIEKRRDVEKDLRHSRECLLLAVEMADLGSFDFYPRTRRLECSDITRRHWSIAPHIPASWELFLSAVHPDDRGRIDWHIKRLQDPGSGGIIRDEYRVIGVEDGKERWIALRGELFYNQDGQAVRLIGVTRDITSEKHNAEMMLRLNRMHAVLTATNQAIAQSRDRETIFREFCQVAIEPGGFELAYVGLIDEDSGLIVPVASAGRTAYLDGLQLTSRLEPEGMDPSSRSAREGGLHVCNDFYNDPATRIYHDRALRHGLQASASIALRQNDRVVGILALYAGEKGFFDSHQVELIRQMGQDVSLALGMLDNEQRRKEAEHALREKEQQLVQQSRHAAMGEMISNIAHQWRQPLNNLGLSVQQLLLMHDLGQFNREFLADCVERSMELIQHMSTTIDDFRSYFRPNKEKVQFCAYQSVVRALSLMEGSFNVKHVEVTIDGNSDAMIFGYPNEFAQVLINILSNAGDASVERNITRPRITISIFSEGSKTVITISDNAGGIPDSILGKIFDPYFTTKEPQTGTGMGLFMSKSIIENNMDGRLSVRNGEEGAEFRIEL